MRRPFDFVLGLLAGVAGMFLYTSFDADRQEWERYRDVRDFALAESVHPVERARLADHALRGMLAGIDRHARFYDAEEAAALERETGGRYRGIGVVLKRPIAEGRVLFTLPGSPAGEAGLRVGDRVLAIDGREYADLAEEEVREALSRDSDDPVEISVERLDGTRHRFEIVRASVIEPTLRGERMLDGERGIGYIALHSFSGESTGEFDAAFERLSRRGMRGLVLDLRGNGGGVLTSAIEIARRFVAEGVIVTTAGRHSVVTHGAQPERASSQGFPLVVLVDEESASASEVLAGALQDHRAAVIVGAPTWGKGTVQTIRRFPAWKTAAKVTTSYYLSPSNRSFEIHGEGHFGIAPDVLVELAEVEAEGIRAYLARQTPPPDALAEIRAWEDREHVRVVDDPPRDLQLACALDLLTGRTLAFGGPAR